MHFLLAGATGFVGTELGITLVRAGHTLTVVCRDEQKARLQLPYPCRLVTWDGRSSDVIYDLLAQHKIDGIVNLAGEGIEKKPWTNERKKVLVSSRTGPTSAILIAIKKIAASLPDHRPSVMLNASAIGWYGDRPGVVCDETTAAGKGFLSETCELWEKSFFTPEVDGLRRVAVRIGVVLGKGGGALAKLAPIFRRGAGASLGKQHMSWIHIHDLTRMIEWALTQDIAGVVNGVSQQPVTNEHFARVLAKTMRRPLLPAPPRFMLKLALRASMGERAALVLSDQNILPQRAKDFRFDFATIESALDDLYGRPVAPGQDELYVRQWFPVPVEKIFPFFQDEKNLERITPSTLNFQVIGKSTPQLQAGTLIDYRLRVHGFPLRWRTEIIGWNAPKEFVDVQLRGPYRLWHHTHSFESLGGGTLMTDRIQFKVPMGILGDVSAGWFVRADVEKIFAFRRLATHTLFTS